jgi:hypothetical protein
MRAAEETVTQPLGRTPDDSELGRHLRVLTGDVRETRRAHQAPQVFTVCSPKHRYQPAMNHPAGRL